MSPRLESAFAQALVALSLATAAVSRAEEPVPIEEEPLHRLRFENGHVRFFDVRLPPGYRSVVHIHHHDGVFVNIAPSETEAEDWGKAPVRRPGRTPGETYYIGYAARPKAHRVSNVGQSLYHVTDTEILRGCGGARPVSEPGRPAIVDNAVVRATRLEIAPGDTAVLDGPCGMLVSVGHGRVRLDAPGGPALLTLEPAGFHWRDSRVPITLTNLGSEPWLGIDILVK